MSRRARTVVATLAALAALGLVAAAAVVGLGLYNVSARAGHLPGVEWVLHTTYERAVRLRAPAASEVPDLTEPALVALGARHFDAACRTCHGAPGEMRTATARSLVPVPPHVQQTVEGWQPQHLHWIVSEGVKMSGMPHWPARRPGEVWSVVAFLVQAPTMSGERYAELTAAPPEADEPTLGYCAGCHGMDGVGDLGPHVPRLDIQPADYLATALKAYRFGLRSSGIMQHAVSEPDPEALARMVDHYAALPAGPAMPSEADPDLVESGAALAAAEAGDDDVPACRACHGPEPTERAAATPSLAGQHREYLATQLRLWRDGRRGGGRRANLMHLAAHDLSEHDIAALAAYYASLTPAKPGGTARAGR